MSRRARSTPDALQSTAERLFAEHGIAAVSNRRVAEEAGAANNSAVRYHFGSKEDLVLAIVREHAAAMEEIRRRMLAEVAGSADPRDYISCLFLPFAEHLARTGPPTWLARFMLQARTDPVLRELVIAEEGSGQYVREAKERLRSLTAASVDAAVMERRGVLAELLITHAYADYERELGDGLHTRPDWAGTGRFVRDVVAGLLLAPSSDDDLSTELALRPFGR
ncbi:TetR/AcrR family transcriptional regulator [Nocardiopsis gilva YIM 90087]|uniref:TetR/AcrR family transcriptional regulator n=1 Tax=Nocardiopsis gilva YIM 90087 TaxID=1235441 RepID=A0A223SCG1_9ACTN|nr:TetR/AcrR family transcriptional regulator [Nocardiopsis gilva]ASU85844.1 TetR/AcrR family transcriptional regulator [Nocardiopsis gilva YIM 90087]